MNYYISRTFYTGSKLGLVEWPWLASNLWSSCVMLCTSWDYRHMSPLAGEGGPPYPIFHLAGSVNLRKLKYLLVLHIHRWPWDLREYRFWDYKEVLVNKQICKYRIRKCWRSSVKSLLIIKIFLLFSDHLVGFIRVWSTS